MRTSKEAKDISDVVIIEAGRLGFQKAFKLHEQFNIKFLAKYYSWYLHSEKTFNKYRGEVFERWMPLMANHADAYKARLEEYLQAKKQLRARPYTP